MAAIPADISTLRESIEVQNISNHAVGFSIVVPPVLLAQLYVCPVCLTLQPKERARVQVEFKPTSEYVSLFDEIKKDDKEKGEGEGEEGEEGEGAAGEEE